MPNYPFLSWENRPEADPSATWNILGDPPTPTSPVLPPSQLEAAIPGLTAFRRLLLRHVLSDPTYGNAARAIILMGLESELKPILIQKYPDLARYETMGLPQYKEAFLELDRLFAPYYHQVRMIIQRDLPQIGASPNLVDFLVAYDIEKLKSGVHRVSYICFLIILAGILTFDQFVPEGTS